MGRYGSPALLITVDRFDGRSQELGHLPLGLFQFFPEKFEFRAVHTGSHIFAIDGIVKNPTYCACPPQAGCSIFIPPRFGGGI